MAAAFRNFNSIRKLNENAMDRENLPPAFGASKVAGKANLLSERRHAGRKQAFGELNNVLHNAGAPTPMKIPKNNIFSSITPTKNISTPKETSKLKKTSTVKKTSARRGREKRTVPSIDSLPTLDQDYDNLEYIWAEKSVAAAERAMVEILRGGNDDDLLLPIPDISSMETFESIFVEIEPVPLETIADHLEPELPPLPSIEWDNMLFDF